MHFFAGKIKNVCRIIYAIKKDRFKSVFFINGGAEVTKLELIINKFIEKVRTFEMFELGRMIDHINLKIAA